MKIFKNTKLTFATFIAIAVLGFGINIFFKASNNITPANNTSEASNTASQRHSSQTRQPNLVRQARIKTENRKTNNSQPTAKNKNSTQGNTSTTANAEARAKEEELAKKQSCHESSLDEVGYITEAYNQNNLDLTSANQQILHYMNTCNRQQITSIVEKIFTDSDDVMHSMSLLLEILPQMDRSLSVINAIKQQDFSHNDMQQLIAMTADQPTSIKQALIPSIVRNDNLDNFLSLTQQDNFFSSIEERTGSYPTDEETSQMIQGIILSQRHNIQTEGVIYNHLLNTYPNSDTQNALTKIALTTNQ